ncbi:GreA/GreB family elongation factor [Chryseobacterium zhengzhouense]|uniref:GreA/GreB family elongation factor n=1 Tax=Chryseobacterium zhengzhouense TaxID=1636086 RepID=A0ABW2M2K7_9FLAO
MSEQIILTTGIYDLIKDHLRRKKTTAAEEKVLLSKLRNAKQVLRRDLPKDIVTINSEVKIKDSSQHHEQKFLIVPDDKAKVKKGKYSVLSDIALAIVGNKVGEVIDWPFKEGNRKIEILSVEHIN